MGNIPAAVQRQAEEADRAMEAVEKAIEDERSAAAEAAAAPPEEAPPPAPQEAEPVPPAAPSSEPPAPETPGEPGPSEVDSLRAEVAKLRQDFATLQGIHAQNVEYGRRLKAEGVDLRKQIDLLNDELKQSKPPKGPAHQRHLSDEEIKDLDENVADLQARMARGVAEDVLESAREQQRSRDSDERERELRILWALVDAKRPGAAEMDRSDPGWSTFLDSVEPKSGKTYGEIALECLRKMDVDGMVAVVDIYRKPPAGSVGAPAGGGKAEDLVRPRPSPTGPPPAPAKKARYKESEIAAFVRDYTRGLYKGREAEAKRKQEEYETAQAEGRVIPGM